MHREQLPGAHRMRDRGKPRAKYRKCIRARRNQREKGRSHFRHWEPGRCPLLPIAWLSLLHSRPVQAHQAAPAAELRRCQGDVDSTYPPWRPRAAVTPETTRAERSVEQIFLWKRREGSADSVGPAQPSARVHGADGPCLVDKPDL